jgi:hypothetical protein
MDSLLIIIAVETVFGLPGLIIGNTRGRWLLGLCLGLLLGPIGWILVLCFGDASAECPQCCKAIDAKAKLCPYCRSVVAAAPAVARPAPVKSGVSFAKTITPIRTR